MMFDQRMKRLQHRRTGADLVGQRRYAQVNSLPPVAFALPVQRLVLTKLLEQDHRQQVGAGKAARRHMEWRWRLGDGLALPAREPLPHRLDDLPLPRDHLQRLGDVFAQLRQLSRTTARAALRDGDHDALARQMLGERLTGRPLALERLHGLRPRRRLLGRQLILGRRRLQLLKLKLHLLQQPRLTLRASAVKLPLQLLDLQFVVGDKCDFRTGIGELGFRLETGGALGNDHRVRSGKIGRQRFKWRGHATTESYSSVAAKQKTSSHRGRSPCFLRMTPVNARQEITELRRRDRHYTVGRARPQEAAALQSLREQAGTLAVMPDHFQQIAAPPTKAKQMPAQRIAAQHFLHLQRQTRKTLPHIRVSGRQPNPYAGRNGNHRRRLFFPSTFISADTVAATAEPVIRSRVPSANSISITLDGAAETRSSGVTATAANRTSLRGASSAPSNARFPVRACRRQK